VRVYEVFRKGFDGDARDIKKWPVAVGELVERLPSSDPDFSGYEYKRKGEEDWHFARSKPRLKEILSQRTIKVGEAYFARRLGGKTFIVRAIEVITVPACPVSSPTPAIKELWDLTYKAFLALGDGFEFVYMGGFVCRRIDGSSSWSNHAFHNAFDFRIRKAKADSGSIDTTATSKVVNAVKSKVAEALWLVASHYFHAHLTGDPKKFGTPECA
jgi:hypothetical protein